MKKLILPSLILAAGTTIAAAQGAQGVLVKQRAKEVRDQSNVRQGVATPAQPAQPAAAPRPAAPTANPKQQNISRLQTDLAALNGRTDVATETRQRLARNLLAAAQGTTKPSSTTAASVVDHLVTVMAGANIESSARARLAQNLNAVFDCASIPADRVTAILSDVQAILQVGGVRRQDALTVVASLRQVVTEVQGAPAR